MGNNRKIKAAPELGDVYRAAPATSTTGDAHGQNKRPVGVVALEKRVVKTLIRTTQIPGKTDLSRESSKNPAIGLSKDGYWVWGNQRPIMRHHFANPDKCQYLGRLPASEKSQLLGLWDNIKALGLANR